MPPSARASEAPVQVAESVNEKREGGREKNTEWVGADGKFWKGGEKEYPNNKRRLQHLIQTITEGFACARVE
jgi:hypothetical protein